MQLMEKDARSCARCAEVRSVHVVICSRYNCVFCAGCHSCSWYKDCDFRSLSAEHSCMSRMPGNHLLCQGLLCFFSLELPGESRKEVIDVSMLCALPVDLEFFVSRCMMDFLWCRQR